ncbi:MAG: tetratricopeptide repeat protein [Alphaproteobacteria bacterium]
MRFLVGTLGALAILSLVFFSGSVNADLADDDWYEVRTPNFLIFTNGRTRKIEKLAVELEHFRTALLMLTNVKATEDYLPFRIYALASKKDFQSVVDSDQTVGIYKMDMDGQFAVIDLSAKGYDNSGRYRKNSSRILKHEYVHYLLHNNTSVRYPAWFQEGMAEYYSTLEFDGLVLKIGMPIAGRHLTMAYEDFASMEFLLASEMSSARINTDQFYAQSWLLMHHLLSDEQQRPKLPEYIERYNEEGTSLATFKAVIYPDLDQLSERLQKAWKRNKYPAQRAEFRNRRPDPYVSSRELSRSEKWVELADLTYSFRGRSALDEVRQLYMRAADLDPNNQRAPATLARLLIREGDLDKAKTYLAQENAEDLSVPMLIAQGDYAFADALRVADGYNAMPAELLEKARDRYLRALEANADSVAAFYGFALTYFGSETPSSDAQLALDQARLLLPSDDGLMVDALVLAMQNGDFERAQKLLVEVRRWQRNSRVGDLTRIARRSIRDEDSQLARHLAFWLAKAEFGQGEAEESVESAP